MDEYGECSCRRSHFKAGKGHMKDSGSCHLLELYQQKMSYIYTNKCGIWKEHHSLALLNPAIQNWTKNISNLATKDEILNAINVNMGPNISAGIISGTLVPEFSGSFVQTWKHFHSLPCSLAETPIGACEYRAQIISGMKWDKQLKCLYSSLPSLPAHLFD